MQNHHTGFQALMSGKDLFMWPSIFPLAGLGLFVGHFGRAVLWRKCLAEHKRLSYLSPRTFFTRRSPHAYKCFLLALGPVWIFGLPTGLTSVALTYDTLLHRRMYVLDLFGWIVLITSFPLGSALAGTET